MKPFDLEAHRGGRDARPENTLFSYAYAIELGATTIECDMQLTADGEIVLSHNPCLNPDLTLDPQGRRVVQGAHFFTDMTLEQVRAFDVGHMDPATEYYQLHGRTQVPADAAVPTLRELFQLVKDSGNPDVCMNIETKAYPDPALGVVYEKSMDKEVCLARFLALVREFGFEERVILQSFDWSTLVRMKELEPRIRTSALYSCQPAWGPGGDTLLPYPDRPSPWLAGLDLKDYRYDPVAAAHAIRADIISPYFAELSKDQVDRAHGWGMEVIPWTVNDPRDMDMLIAMGVDGIISDQPWVLRAVLEKHGLPLLPPWPFPSPYHLEPDHLEAGSAAPAGGRDASH